MEAVEIHVRMLLQFVVQVTVQLIQNDLKLHHGTVAVHVLHTGVHVLFVPQLSLVSSELLLTQSVFLCLPLSPFFIYSTESFQLCIFL